MLGPEIRFCGRDKILYQDKEYLYLGGIDYHRMSTNPIIADTICQAVKEYGLSPTGSRTTTGNHVIYRELERKVADFFETESAAVFTTGYLSNLILLQAVLEDFDLFYIDEMAHSSLASALRISEAEVNSFKFLDAQHLSELIARDATASSRILVVTDGVFPARGDIAPLQEYVEIISKYEGKILVDDAHAMAVIGPSGKGSWEEEGVDRRFIYQTGTLSKGFGTLGGVIPGSSALIEDIQNKSGAYVGSTGLALPLAVAGIKSIEILMENPALIADLQRRALDMKRRFIQMGFDMPDTSVPIFSISYHDERRNLRLRDLLLDNGIYPPFINYPGAPAGGHFRFIITSQTGDDAIDLLINTIENSL